MDGQRALSHENTEQGQYGNEPPCARVQPEARNETGRNGCVDGSDEGLTALLLRNRINLSTNAADLRSHLKMLILCGAKAIDKNNQL